MIEKDCRESIKASNAADSDAWAYHAAPSWNLDKLKEVLTDACLIKHQREV